MRRIAALSGLLMLLLPCATSAAAPTERVAISGRALLAIQAALPEFRRRGLERVERYEISVWETNSVILVSFSDPSAPEDCLGSCGALPALGVELNAEDLQVLDSHFVR